MESVLTKNQTLELTKTEGGYIYDAVIRYDDQCGNGHNSFSITGTLWRGKRTPNTESTLECCGCTHEEFRKFFPEYAHLLKWHHMTSDGPMHYVANTLYHASNRDCHGLLKGESRQIVNGKSGLPAWELVRVSSDDLPRYIDSETQPEGSTTYEYRPWCRVGEGKERNFDAARSCAVWPDATDEQLSLPPEELKALLLERAPALQAEFKRDVESLGFVY